MMWFLLLALAVLVFIAAVVIAVLAARTLSPGIKADISPQAAEGAAASRQPRDVAILVVAAVFLLQACCILVAFIASKVQAGANPWG